MLLYLRAAALRCLGDSSQKCPTSCFSAQTEDRERTSHELDLWVPWSLLQVTVCVLSFSSVRCPVTFENVNISLELADMNKNRNPGLAAAEPSAGINSK